MAGIHHFVLKKNVDSMFFDFYYALTNKPEFECLCWLSVGGGGGVSDIGESLTYFIKYAYDAN